VSSQLPYGFEGKYVITPSATFNPPEGTPSPATPEGSSKPTTPALICFTLSAAGGVCEHACPKTLWNSVAAVAKSAHARESVQPWQEPVSLPTMACSGDEGDRSVSACSGFVSPTA